MKAKGYAAQTPKSDLAPWNFDRREPGSHDVQMDIIYCGVCHSDLHQVRNEWFEGIFPMVPGHEIVGKVVKTGDHVKNFKAGDLAAVGVMVDSCRTCDNCKSGMEQYCGKGNVLTYNSLDYSGSPTYGGYSDKIVVNEDFVFHVSEKLDLSAVAPLLCAGITTYSPLKHWKVGKGHKLAIMGLGGLGHMGVKYGAALGAEVTVLSTSPSKKQDALKLGAHNFVLTSNDDQFKNIKGHFDFILDTVSASHDYNKFLALVKTDGTYICVGLPPRPPEIGIFNLIDGRKSLAGSTIGSLEETREMLNFCAEKNIVSVVELIEMKYINTAYERLLKGDVKYRFVIDMKSL